MKKNNFKKIQAIILLIFLIIAALVFSLLIFKFVDIIYGHFSIILSITVDDSEDGEILHLLGYFQMVFGLTIGALIGRFIFLRIKNENFNSEERLIFKWILLGCFISFLPAGILEQILLKEHGYNPLINLIVFVLFFVLGAASWRFYRINLSRLRSFSIWRIKITYEEDGLRSSSWIFIVEASSEKNAVDISKKYLLNLFCINEGKIKWLFCEGKNINTLFLFKFFKSIPKGKECILTSYIN